MSLFPSHHLQLLYIRASIIQSPRLRSTLHANIHFLFPGARIDLQIALGCGKHLVCVCVCVCVCVRAWVCELLGEKGLPPFALPILLHLHWPLWNVNLHIQ